MRKDRERLEDILEAISQIEKYAIEGKEKFDQDELIQTWIVHHLLIIGEASTNISLELKQEYSNVPWTGPIDVRNIIAHEYFRVDLELIWRIVEDDLPNFTGQIQEILSEIS